MKVLVAEKLGFCFGVEKAVALAERLLAQGKEVYCLGPLIHNEQAVERLEQKGLHVVHDLSEIKRPPTVPPRNNTAESKRGSQLEPGKVALDHQAEPSEPIAPTILIRSHGCDPRVLAEVKSRGYELADATCILVKRLQRLVRDLSDEGYRVIVVGDPDHPEIAGVQGYADNVIVLADEKDLAKLPDSPRLAVLSQTTRSAEDFGRIVGLIAAAGYEELKVVNTICRETARRQASAIELCSRVDVMFVLGGRDSANTAELAELCRAHGVRTYHLQDWTEFNAQYVAGKSIAGVTAGASTPEWVISGFVAGLSRL